MANKLLRFIRPLSNAAEYEYIKEFFHFIGCFTSNEIVDDSRFSKQVKPKADELDFGQILQMMDNHADATEKPAEFFDLILEFLHKTREAEESNLEIWDEALHPEKVPDRVDVVINFFGQDPYLEECRQQNIDRIYCYFDFDKKWGMVTDNPLSYYEPKNKVDQKPELRFTVLNQMVDRLWKSDVMTRVHLKKIVKYYCGAVGRKDVFHLLQVKKNLRLLNMNDIFSVPDARIDGIPMIPYIKESLNHLVSMYCSLEDCNNEYCLFVRINIQAILHEFGRILNPAEMDEFREIVGRKGVSLLMNPSEMLRVLRLIDCVDPDFISAKLLAAKILQNAFEKNCDEQEYYEKMLCKDLLCSKEYAFIRYRIGHLHEKKYGDRERALDFYRETYEIDREYFPAMFKIGYFNAAEGLTAEAEWWLRAVIKTILHGGELNGNNKHRHSLSMKECQYLYKTYMLLAKIAINDKKEHIARQSVINACLALVKFEEASIVMKISDPTEYEAFLKYHRQSPPVWAMWKVLEYWGKNLVSEPYVDAFVGNSMARWKLIGNISSSGN